MRIKHFLSSFLLLFAVQSQAQNIQMLSNLSQQLGTSEYRLMESVEMGGNLYFTTWSTKGTELWQTNGRACNLIYQWKQAKFQYEYAVNKLYAYKNQLLFTGIDSMHGKELWTSDGTSAGTHLLKDLNPGVKNGFNPSPRLTSDRPNKNYYPFVPYNGKICFTAVDGAGNAHLWTTDGTEQGTVMLLPISPDPTLGLASEFGVMNQKFFLTALYSSQNFGAYVTDGTTSGTIPLIDGSIFQDFILHSGKMYFNQSSKSGLWCSDGTVPGTVKLGANLASSSDWVSLNNRLYFFNGANNQQFYSTDGTVGGTVKINDTISKPGTFQPIFQTLEQRIHFPVVFNGSIYFCNANQLWKSDGTAAGTQFFKNFEYDFSIDMFAAPQSLIATGNKMYFKAWNGARIELFETDGTAAGTKTIALPAPNYFETYIMKGGLPSAEFPNEEMMMFGKRLIFTEVYDTTVGKALYMIDVAPLSVKSSNANRAELLISPNPATSTLNIRYPENQFEQATVVDVTGRIVYHQTINKKGNDVLNLPVLTSGQYFVRLSGNGQSISAPAIIAR
jgi:ELWxxDGT repeat protein